MQVYVLEIFLAQNKLSWKVTMNRSVTQPDTDDSEPEMLTLASESRKRQSTSTSTNSATSKRTKHGIARAMAKVNEVLASLDTKEKSGSDISSSGNEEEESIMVVIHNDLSYYSD